MNYYISDIHFGCQNSFDNRTLEHDTIVKENWNREKCKSGDNQIWL